jgi:hypothetical protein
LSDFILTLLSFKKVYGFIKNPFQRLGRGGGGFFLNPQPLPYARYFIFVESLRCYEESKGIIIIGRSIYSKRPPLLPASCIWGPSINNVTFDGLKDILYI